ADRLLPRQLHLRADVAVDPAVGDLQVHGDPRRRHRRRSHSDARGVSRDGRRRRRRRQRVASHGARAPRPSACLPLRLHPAPMTATSLPFLKRLLDTPGPSGFETAPARVWREETKGFADEVRGDTHGNSVAVINPKGVPRLMFAGHIDEIGLQVTHVDDEGYVYFAAIGGWDPQVLVGQRGVIAGPKGAVRGVIGKQAIHLMKKEDMDKASKITDLWIDIGSANRAAALE